MYTNLTFCFSFWVTLPPPPTFLARALPWTPLRSLFGKFPHFPYIKISSVVVVPFGVVVVKSKAVVVFCGVVDVSAKTLHWVDRDNCFSSWQY